MHFLVVKSCKKMKNGLLHSNPWSQGWAESHHPDAPPPQPRYSPPKGRQGARRFVISKKAIKRLRRQGWRATLRHIGRKCSLCGCIKPIDEFGVDNSPRNPSGRTHRCLECSASVARATRDADIELSREKERRKYRRWKERNPESYKASIRKQYESRTPQRRMIENMRKRFREVLKLAKSESQDRFGDVCGCTARELREHLEQQFVKGMTWENYGEYWHVDHIMPASAFDHSDPEQARRCWHFTNLRPLEAKENISKHAKIISPQLQLGI